MVVELHMSLGESVASDVRRRGRAPLPPSSLPGRLNTGTSTFTQGFSEVFDVPACTFL